MVKITQNTLNVLLEFCEKKYPAQMPDVASNLHWAQLILKTLSH